jgi:uncharacterized membrane protein YdbT with pleckstrin-like domain|tara:strand:- start:598 stop:1080 length:483 start_codon:yes stop_codon:yes gene_type:complete
MSYIENTLSGNEKILSTHKFHWFFFFFPSLFMFLSLWGKITGFFMTLSFFLLETFPILPMTDLYDIFVILASVFFLKRLIDYFCTEQVFTNKRICLKVGLIRRNTNELRNDAVENIQINQSILGRVLGYGHLKFTGRGGSPVNFRFVVNPTQVKKEIEAI